MNAQRCFCKALNINQLPHNIENTYEVASYCQSAAYNVLPPKARTLSGGIFCVLLFGLMLGFSSCGKTENTADDPTRGGGTAPNQGVSFTIDTTWGDTIYVPIKTEGIIYMSKK